MPWGKALADASTKNASLFDVLPKAKKVDFKKKFKNSADPEKDFLLSPIPFIPNFHAHIFLYHIYS